MLDQNTDRSWWMIGAVIVGAALVGLAKKLFPQQFNSVMDFFTSMIPTGLGTITNTLNTIATFIPGIPGLS